MEIHQDTHGFHHSCARVRCFMLGLGNDSWALGNGECSTLPGGGSVAYPTCSKIVNVGVMENATGIPGLQLLLPVLDVCCLNLSVMENHQYGNYHHGLPGAGKPEEYSSKQQKTG